MVIEHGLYGFEGGTALICRCGHTLCVHQPAGPHRCDVEAQVGDRCDCDSFSAIPTHRIVLRSVSVGAVYDDGARGMRKMEVSTTEDGYVAVEYFDWPRRTKFRELGCARTYEGAVELMWRHVAASPEGR